MSAAPGRLPALFRAIEHGEVTYSRPDGSPLTPPFAHALKLRGAPAGGNPSYADIAPLSAAAG